MTSIQVLHDILANILNGISAASFYLAVVTIFYVIHLAKTEE